MPAITDKIGAVLVVGGGIGGMQAALDLADSGFKVYLVEKGPAIGGVMAQLDKTFPTNDCAMCTMAPRLVTVARHPNVSLITYSTIDEIDGKAGNFRVRVRQHKRLVDLEKCTGCGECESACPVELADEFNLGLSQRKAIYRPYPQAIPNAFTIDKLDGKSPCKVACPANVNAQAYVQLISQGKFAEALAETRKQNPFPAICGRVCHHPCEQECLRRKVEEPIAIRSLKRFVVDYAVENGEEKPDPVEPTKNEKVAVVGAGPSGLTCALRLQEMGYPTTVIDASDTPGGMMTSCLPEYRIPKESALYDIDRILARGMALRGNTRVGQDVTFDQLRKEFDAIYVALGAQDPAKLPLEGVDSTGVLYGLPFLRDAKANAKPDGFGKKVIIIGGGNVGIDCAKSSFRLGAKEVHLVCLETRDLESRDRMPAHDWEIEEAEEEGVVIHPCLGPEKIVKENGRVAGLKTSACISVYDEGGRFNPKFDKDRSSPLIQGDTIIIAIGQRSDLTGFEQLDQNRGLIQVDPVSLETSVPGVFAGGDIVTGPASVVEAVHHGNEAAASIDRFLRGQDLKAGREVEEEKIITELRARADKQPRQDMPTEPSQERRKDFREIERGFTEEMAIAEARRCLSCSICCECLQCEAVCEADAIDHDMQEETLDLNVGAVVLAPGCTVYDADQKLELGSAQFENVVTSLQFERILSATGPYGGDVLRPSDRAHASRIAFIQCVGSRDFEHDYCSSVCCMYATKEAIIAKEHAPGLECTIFYMDLRAYGKGFEAYYERAKELGVQYVRCRPSHVEEVPGTRNLKIHYEAEDGTYQTEEFDMVVLSVGLQPPKDAQELAERFGIALDENWFARTDLVSPVATSRDGIYVCGPFAEPKDIPETVMEAGAAAADAMALLSESRGTEIVEREYPPERDVAGEAPRIGVFICHCGRNIGGFLDVPSVVEYAKTLPDVAYAEDNLYTCSTDTQAKMRELMKEHNLNRMIVASCTPRTHEPLFRDTLRESGLNPYLFEMANIRDQCSWIHMNQPLAATSKAKDLVRAAVAKARLLEPLRESSVPVNSAALVVGGGMSGMAAALSLAEQGFEVNLVERENELGGNLRRLHYLITGDDPQRLLDETIKKIDESERINVWTNATIEGIDGYVGNFETTVIQGGDKTKIEHGVVIVATGAKESVPTEYKYGSDDRVVTQLTLEKMLAEGEFDANRVVMIQCVGSRDEERVYCSRVCCSQAVKNALRIKEERPNAEIFILYREMRTYGFREKYYTEARSKGISFIRYDLEEKPVISADDGNLRVETKDPTLGRVLIIDCDLLVLAPAIVPHDDVEQMAQMLSVPLTRDRFFLEAHMKLRPVDFATEGVFVTGLAHSPKSISESISQGEAAAARASRIISKDRYPVEATIASVDEDVCSGCGICVGVCEFGALEVVEKPDGRQVVEVTEALCKGCGSCAATCPSGAMEQRGFKSEQVLDAVEAAIA